MKKILYLGIIGLIIFLVFIKIDYNNSSVVSSDSLQEISSGSVSSSEQKKVSMGFLKKLAAIKEVFSNENTEENSSFVSGILDNFKKITAIFKKTVDTEEILNHIEDEKDPILLQSSIEGLSGSKVKTNYSGISKIIDNIGAIDKFKENDDTVAEYPSIETFFQEIKRREETLVLEENFTKSDEDVKIIITKYFDKETESDIHKLYILKIKEDRVSVFSDFIL